MTLQFVDRKEKEVEGTRYVRATYSLGAYTVMVDDSFYQNGTSRRSIDVSEPWHFRSYNAQIYYRCDPFGKAAPTFEVQTTSFGALSVEEFRKFLEAQHEALEAVEILNREFCGEGALAK